jgi:hypothetical protein
MGTNVSEELIASVFRVESLKSGRLYRRKGKGNEACVIEVFGSLLLNNRIKKYMS